MCLDPIVWNRSCITDAVKIKLNWFDRLKVFLMTNQAHRHSIWTTDEPLKLIALDIST